MKILSIETSCDETAVSVIEATQGEAGPVAPIFRVLSNLVLSQIKLHEKYGGVFPNLAKREHSKNLAPLLRTALTEAGLVQTKFAKEKNDPLSVSTSLSTAAKSKITADLVREPELCEALIHLFETTEKPEIDLIAVTFGPGLEPALWVGINAAKVLGEVWGIPVMPVNHMEGHISSVLLDLKTPVQFPALALLISGGHTELVNISDWLSFKVIGQTRDDAVGEAYDKVARMLGLPYPGGPQIGALAEQARAEGIVSRFTFPRPMIKTDDLDFSFSGLKTSVLYSIKKIDALDDQTKKEIAVAFEDAIVETLVAKTTKAIEMRGSKTLIIAGGVIANKTIRKAFERLIAEKFPDVSLLVPTNTLSTDNALMIALAAFARFTKKPNEKYVTADIVADGNVQLS